MRARHYFDGVGVNWLTAAAHEAGHVLAARVAGFEIEEVEIFSENGGVGGVTRLARIATEKFPEDGYDHVRVFVVAGREAESRWRTRYGDQFPELAHNPNAGLEAGCHTDMANFARMRRKGQGSLSRSQARARALYLITQRGPQVDRFTLRLARTRRVTTV